MFRDMHETHGVIRDTIVRVISTRHMELFVILLCELLARKVLIRDTIVRVIST